MKLSFFAAVLFAFAAVGCAASTEEEKLGTSTARVAADSAPASLEAPAFACEGADLVAALDFTVLEKPQDVFDTGKIRITVSARNLGGAPAGARVQLIGRGPGGHYFPIEERTASSVVAGESFSFDVDRDWSPSYEPWEAFKVVIIDATNDCFAGNNEVERSRSEINALFR